MSIGSRMLVLDVSLSCLSHRSFSLQGAFFSAFWLKHARPRQLSYFPTATQKDC